MSSRVLVVLLVLAGSPLGAQALPAEVPDTSTAPAPERIDPEEIRRLAGEVLEDRAYQTELPDGSEPRLGGGAPTFSAFGPWVGDLLLVVLGIGLVAFVCWVAIQLWRSRGLRRSRSAEGAQGAVEDGVDQGRPEVGRPAVPGWGEVEGMIARGALGEAVRALLVRAVLRLATAGPGQAFPASWTSREILGGASVDGDRRSALALLTGTVERWLFGGRAVTDEDARDCLAAARTLGDGPGVPP
jgi:hypothetical protein